MATAYRVVLVAVPTGGKAESMADSLVESRLAACVNVLPGVVSIYRWKGRVHRDAESLLVIKTTVARYPALERWIKAHHAYETPEIISLPVAAGSKEYLSWLASSVK
ncbi:MAG TPA: divalent-cation tolerance protein CutA [Elusimicrobiota bacterium]|nr:divalent-cation tolerance protein CutA [Elusimicrobiota bacterium]